MSAASNHQHTTIERILSATVGSIITSFVVTPLDVVKVRLQSQSSNGATATASLLSTSSLHVTGTADGLHKIARQEGLRTLYRGLVPTLVMSVPSTVIYFLGYEWTRERVGRAISGLDDRVVSVAAPLLSGSFARSKRLSLLTSSLL